MLINNTKSEIQSFKIIYKILTCPSSKSSFVANKMVRNSENAKRIFVPWDKFSNDHSFDMIITFTERKIFRLVIFSEIFAFDIFGIFCKPPLE